MCGERDVEAVHGTQLDAQRACHAVAAWLTCTWGCNLYSTHRIAHRAAARRAARADKALGVRIAEAERRLEDYHVVVRPVDRGENTMNVL